MRSQHRKTSGFTLVEALMAVVIVSGVLVAAVGTFGAIGRGRQAQVDRVAAAHLASRLMSEIEQCYYMEPGSSASATLGPEAGESARDAFDDVDDYSGYTASPPKLRNGTALTGYTNWTHAVTVDRASVNDPSATSATETGLKRIRVTVTSPSGSKYVLDAVRSSNGAYEQSPTTTTNYLLWGGVSTQVGANGKVIYSGAHPLNIQTDQ